MSDKTYIEPQRVNARISGDLNKWLDETSKEMAIPKSTIIAIAVEQYRQQKEAIKVMPEMQKLLEKLDEKVEATL